MTSQERYYKGYLQVRGLIQLYYEEKRRCNTIIDDKEYQQCKSEVNKFFDDRIDSVVDYYLLRFPGKKYTGKVDEYSLHIPCDSDECTNK